MPNPALAIQCPICKVGRNRKCKGVPGNHAIRGDVHEARIRLARREESRAQTLHEKLPDGTPVNVTVTDSRKGK